MLTIDLNCDMGESFGRFQLGQDDRILPFVSSVNIACGFHAGDPTVMRKTVRLAVEHQVAIGAHPGFLDLQGFGRRNMVVDPEEIMDWVMYQIGALHAFVKAEGISLHHVKPHGALYNMAAKDASLANAIVKAVYRVDPNLILYGLSGSELIRAGNEVGLRTASEVFADRTYQEDGTLTPRNHPKALLTSTSQAVEQVIRMAKQGTVVSMQGAEIKLQAETVCIHGDGAHAAEFAKHIHEQLIGAGIAVKKM